MALKLQSKNIPHSPGVYIYSARGIILYVGKANNLRSRIKSYFAKNIHTKTKTLMKEANNLSWEVVGSEVEALIRESELIKKWKPKYNIFMRDDKQYLYVGFGKEKFPKIFITHQPNLVTKLLSDHIGPFTESVALKSTLKILRRIFPYCTCKQLHKTSCLNAKIGKCLGFCCVQDTENNDMSERIYSQNIRAIKKILTGKNKSLIKTLEKKMKRLSKTQHYEEAGKIRDQIRSLEKVFAHSKIIKKDVFSDRSRALNALGNILKIKNIARIEGYDVSNIHGQHAYGSMVVFVDGFPQTDQYRIYKIRASSFPSKSNGYNLSAGKSDDPRMIGQVIERRLKHHEWSYPNVILIDGGPTQLSAALKAYNSSNGRRTSIQIKIVSLAKREEELYLSPHQKPIKIKESSESLYSLLTHIRNEAHRFAIKYYRKEHKKTLLNLITPRNSKYNLSV